VSDEKLKLHEYSKFNNFTAEQAAAYTGDDKPLVFLPNSIN
jgi:hypothetical protein